MNDISGVLLINKPSGLSSAKVVAIVKGRLKARKAGHGGTLDPAATGLLVILLGKATKLSSLFLEGGKTYSGFIRLGLETDTLDLEGQPVKEDPEGLEKLRGRDLPGLARELEEQFTGPQLQVPPVYSAIKVGGRKSYDLARADKAVDLPAREIEIYKLELEFTSDLKLRYFLDCSKGTYVRSLARDLGQAIGVPACIESLQRDSSGRFNLSAAVELDLLSLDNYAQYLIPPENFALI